MRRKRISELFGDYSQLKLDSRLSERSLFDIQYHENAQFFIHLHFMGATASTESLHGGFRIHAIRSGSPAESCNLEVFFDFVVQVGGIPILSDVPSFSSIIKEHENEEVEMDIYNIRTREPRTVRIRPHSWGGSGLVGLVGRFENIEADSTEAVRILEVMKDSPAENAGLVASTDYVIATSDILIRSMDEFAKLIDSNRDRDVRLLVYNSISEQTRGVVIHPNDTGSIGCSVGTGMLHRIPPSRQSNSGPESVPPPLLESRSLSSDPPQLIPFSA